MGRIAHHESPFSPNRFLATHRVTALRMREHVNERFVHNANMASLLKGLLGTQSPETQPSGAEMIEKLRNRYVLCVRTINPKLLLLSMQW